MKIRLNSGQECVTGTPRPAGRLGHHRFYRNIFKRFFDIVIVLIAAVPALAVILPFALVVALDGHSPLYVQDRVGRGGRRFRMWKLRTMVPKAESKLAAYLARNPEARQEWDQHQKLRYDPRVTWIGHILRSSSLDELPQLWNVLKGDMSLVGPRPMMCDQQAIYPGSEYYAMRPGITGLWQTSVRNESSFADRAIYDRDYYLSVSFRTDLRILLRTVWVVTRAGGC
ncbi:MAG: sugar transferase [Rubellimicrobium sp.]|nr:sugar transferase [Rubellimicrobium sp.]